MGSIAEHRRYTPHHITSHRSLSVESLTHAYSSSVEWVGKPAVCFSLYLDEEGVDPFLGLSLVVHEHERLQQRLAQRLFRVPADDASHREGSFGNDNKTSCEARTERNTHAVCTAVR